MKILIWVMGTIMAGAVIAAGLLYAGAYSVAADEPHWPLTHKLIETARERSIAARSEHIEVPPLDDAKLVAEGAEHYAAMCADCHLAPGMEDTEVRRGLYPQPPKLASHEHDEHSHGDAQGSAARRFWIIKHGLKATGMPAWGATHDDGAIWGIVAFLQRLPELTAEEYEALSADASEHSHDGDHAQSDAGHSHEEDSGSDADAHVAAPAKNSPEAAVESFLDALSGGRAEEAERWLAPDVLIYESGGKESSREEYAAHHMRSDMAFLAKVQVERLERTAHGSPDVAWVTSRSQIRGEAKGQPLDLISTETMVLTKEQDGWRIRHVHWSSGEGG